MSGERICCECGGAIAGPDNEDSHDNRDKCVRELRSQLAAERARTDAFVACLPKCEECGAPALAKYDHYVCDACRDKFPNWVGPYKAWLLPYAEALRTILKARPPVSPSRDE